MGVSPRAPEIHQICESSCSGVKRQISEEFAEVKRHKVLGSDDGHMYECSRYVWREKREKSSIESDRKFSSKRMALLYVAKMNSDSLQRYLEESGKNWFDLCRSTGVHALHPNMPFDVAPFLELSDDELEKYGAGVGTIMTVHKAPQGTIYRFRAVPLATMAVEELLSILMS